ALDRLVAVQQQVVRVLDADHVPEVADLEAFDRQIVVLADQHDVAEVALQPIDHRALARRIVPARLEERRPDALRGERRRAVDAADERHALDVEIEGRLQPRVGQDRDRPITKVARAPDALYRTGGAPTRAAHARR